MKKEIVRLHIDKIIPDPEQPRQEFDADEMDRLEKSIDIKGIMMPLIIERTKIKGKYLLLDGERRYRAAKKLGLTDIPVSIRAEMDPMERMIIRWHLQDQHSNWSLFDRARAIAFFKDSQKLNDEQVAELLGLSRSTVVNWTALLTLSKRSQIFVIDKRIPYSYARKIALLTKRIISLSGYKSNEVEMKLLKKYENGSLRDSNNFWRINKILINGKDIKQVLEFIDKEKMSVSELLISVKSGFTLEIDRLVFRARKLLQGFVFLQTKNGGKFPKLDAKQENSFQEVLDKIEEIL